MTKKPMKIPAFKSTGFALLDVGVGRKALERYFEKKDWATTKGGCKFIPTNKPIKVIIEAEITDQWGHDDGTSIEFEMRVKNIKVKK